MHFPQWLKSFRLRTRVRRGSSRSRRGPQSERPAEVLEQRTLLSVTSLFVNGELTLISDSGDQIEVREDANQPGQVEIVVNGQTDTSLPPIATTDVRMLFVFGGPDADTIDLRGVTQAVFGNLTHIEVDGGNGDDNILATTDLDDSISGGDGNDILSGGAGNNVLDGGDGNDVVNGGLGDDTLRGEDGLDVITGGDGNDSIDGGNGADSIFGGTGNDTIEGGDHADSIQGQDGDDSILAGRGEDTVDGGAGNDTIAGGEQADSLLGGDGADSIHGNSGDDTVDGQAGDDTVIGGAHDDLVRGGDGNDRMIGNLGDDTLQGGVGDDVGYGGGGRDSLSGGTGNDTLLGQGGADTVTGDTGADKLDGGTGNDLVQSVQVVQAGQFPDITISDASVTEGDAGTNNTLVFTVTLSQAFTQDVMVDFTTVDGTATAGVDYQAASGTLLISAGQTTATISVTVIGDDVVEPDETLMVELSNPINASVSDIQAVGTILNDDTLPPPAGDFDIVINLTGSLTAGQMLAFQEAESRWEQIIIGDVPDVMLPTYGLVDDIVIDASVVPIDGPGGILGQAGPVDLRMGSSLPASGVMQFDSADLASLEASGQLRDTILHEMGHVLGFGTIWEQLNLITNPSLQGGTDPRFTGSAATAEYNARFGVNESGVPLETMGGPGTADSHWRESVFTNELMTGFLDPGTNPLSRITIASMQDLGYQVDFNQADPFLRTGGGIGSTMGRLEVLRGPRRMVAPVDPADVQGMPYYTGNMPTTSNLTITPTANATDILNALIGGGNAAGVNVTNIQVSSQTGLFGEQSIGTFTVDAVPDVYGLETGGVIMSTGDVSDYGPGPNTSSGNSTSYFVPATAAQEALLDQITGGTLDHNDVTQIDITFDMLPGFDTLYFNVVFGSEEYPEFVGSSFIDAFGIFINGTNTAFVNNLPINVDHPDMATVSGTELDGVLAPGGNPVVTFAVPVTPGSTGNTLTFIVADSSDSALDTTVYIASLGGMPPGLPPQTPVDLEGDTLMGGDGDDTIVGADGNDKLTGGSGNDSMDGAAGNDTLFGGAGEDTMDGGDGDDSLQGQGGNDSITGGGNEDRIVWNGSADGNDTVAGGDGSDVVEVRGTAAADIYRVDQRVQLSPSGSSIVGTDLQVTDGTEVLTILHSLSDSIEELYINPRGGSDYVAIGDLNFVSPSLVVRVDGGAGNDRVTALGSDLGPNLLVANGGRGIDQLTGSRGNDTLDGGTGNDIIDGGAGNDSILGGDDEDSLTGGTGNDTIQGQDGNDTIFGSDGDDSLLGNAGVDRLEGDAGDDTIDGGFGDDQIVGGDGNDSLQGNLGQDMLFGGMGDDTIDGGRDNDTIRGNGGDDVLAGDHGDDLIEGNDGNDTLRGGDGNDSLVGAAGDDGIAGQDGNDTIVGNGGEDTLLGGDGNDKLYGGAGKDVALGGDGDDTVNGQGSADTVAGNQGVDAISDPAGEIDELFKLPTDVLDAIDQ
ncbi:MAG: hypothetical protein D6725_00270 [Planctomycetota bacterium]|nr:MAG: hypothetical protein D6725_00270 [Planctomycetota bacterium]